jgi:nucleoid DNA-binding protein
MRHRNGLCYLRCYISFVFTFKERDFILTTLTRANWCRYLNTAFEKSAFSKSTPSITNFTSPLANHVVNSLASILSAGNSIQLRYVGNIVVLDKAARPGCNPKTGERVEITARKSVSLRKKPVPGVLKRQAVAAELVLSRPADVPAFDAKIALFLYDTFCQFLLELLNGAGDRLEIRHFGVFDVRKYAPRKAHNPKTGDPVSLKERQGLHFSASDVVLRKLNR